MTSIDSWGFMGYELFVAFIANLLRHNRLELIKELLSESLYVDNFIHGGPDDVSFTWISDETILLKGLPGSKGSNWLSPQGEFVRQRHATDGAFAGTLSAEDFFSTDYFLLLLSWKNSQYERWKPWTAPYFREWPRFLMEAKKRKQAERLCSIFECADIEGLRRLVDETSQYIFRIFGGRTARFSLPMFDTASIGSK